MFFCIYDSWPHCEAEAKKQYETFMTGRAKYVELYNQSPGGYVSCRMLDIQIQVRVKKASGVGLEEFLGWFWPEAVYCKKKGAKPAKEDVVMVEHMNKKIKGVILDNDEPHVIGCIRITQFSKVEVFKTTDATNSQTSQTSQATVRLVWTRCIRT